MVRKLLRGERTAGVLTFCGIGAVLCLLAASFALTVTYRDQSESFKKTLYDRCQTRHTYDAANHDSIGADVDLYKAILAQQLPDSEIPAQFRDLARQQRLTIQKALAAKEKALASSVPGDCGALTR